jgi:hypothetical protein
MKDTIVCDLDGTLCDITHRRHYVENKPKNWDAFYAGVSEDKPNEAVVSLLRSSDTYESIIGRIIFVTGRPERCREDTLRWLHKHSIIGGYCDGVDGGALYMRKDGDYRADYIVKQEILDAHIDKSRVLFVLDDRKQVVDMWRRNGLVCFQVAEGDF